MEASETPNLDGLKERVNRLHSLLEDPHPGLVSWNMMLGDTMNELVEWWTEDD